MPKRDNKMTTDGNNSPGVARAFPPGFVWGASTAAYQIEGATQEGGRGVSVWDTFSHIPGNVRGGDTGDIACDFYHRYRDDVKLMAELGLKAFRFSVAWPRIQPTGRGPANRAGIDFYRSLVDVLLKHGIEPMVTLFHWDLPQPLEDQGGWANRDTAERFAEYAEIVAASIGDHGGPWVTVNEPQVVTHEGYRIGIHAPGHRDNELAAATTHHLLLAHGLALARLRTALPEARLGIALDMHAVKAAEPAAEEVASIADAEMNRIFMDPLLHGSYPAKAREHMLPPAALIKDGDMDLIAAPIDFLGVNYYSPNYLKRADPGGLLLDETEVPGLPDFVFCKPRELEQTAMGWLIEPDGLYETLKTIAAEIAPGCKIYVTESGCAAEDYINPDGIVDDIERVEYLSSHLEAARRAIEEGVPLAGYFVWSLFDNFEWAWGYQKRFGIVFVEYDTQRRIPKRSASFYRTVALTNGLPEIGLDGDGPAQEREAVTT
jgi:beta-glucosidase